MNIQIRNLTTLRIVLRSLVLLTIFGLCSCAPQGYYYNYPNRRSGYSYNNAAAASTQQRRRPQTASRQSSSYSNNGYSSSNYLDAYSRRAQTTRRPPPPGYGNAGNSYNSKYLTNAYSTRQPAAAANRNSNYQSPADAYTSKRQTSNNNNSENGKYRVSKADKENAKFAGASNQETEDESGKTIGHIKRKRLNRQRLNPCFGFGRDAAGGSVSTTPEPREQGRFLWDLNVYNVYPSSPVIQQSPLSFGGGCGGYGGGLGGGLGGFGGGLGGLGGGGGLLSDPIAPAYGGGGGLNNFLGLFAPGILQNALAVTARPRPQFQADQSDDELNDLQSDPEVDPGYRPQQQAPVRRPNRVYYDSAGAAPITPAQLVGGVATTVNGLIQQLTGNIQPVYQSYRRSANYG